MTSLTGGIVYHDAQVDDARLTVEVARTAASYGALIATRIRLIGFIKDGETVVGVRAQDEESANRTYEIRAQHVISATGVWTDELQAMVTDRAPVSVRASKGIHLVVPKEVIEASSGLIVRTEKSVLFIIPWGEHWIIGTTDTQWDLDRAYPAATRGDINYLLDLINSILERPLALDDIEGVYAGLRPLISNGPGSTTKLSREHAVTHPAPGLTVVTGGKLTTYRVMAKDALDAACRATSSSVARSRTRGVALIGATGLDALSQHRASLTQRFCIEASRLDHLVSRYGASVEDVLALCGDRPELLSPLRGAPGYLCAEVVYAATAELATHLDDVLVRRTRISIETRDRGVAAASEVATLMGDVLGWDVDRRTREVQRYLDLIAAERESQMCADDHSANEVMSAVSKWPDP